MKVDEVIRSAVPRAGVIRVQNALMGFGDFRVFLLDCRFMFRDDPVLKYGFSALGALPIVCAIIAYFLYFFLDRDRLQSEEYRIRQNALQMLYRKEASAEIVDATREIVRTEKLPGGFGDGEKS